jgi:hypothetical protein
VALYGVECRAVRLGCPSEAAVAPNGCVTSPDFDDVMGYLDVLAAGEVINPVIGGRVGAGSSGLATQSGPLVAPWDAGFRPVSGS